jgi:signal peptidase I
MTPTIPIGSAVLVEKGPAHVGQVITFHPLGDGALVTHRLIGVKPDGTPVTKGDGNGSPDLGSIPRSNVVGHVVAAPQHVGAWMNFTFYTPLGWVFDALILLIRALIPSGTNPVRKRPDEENAWGPPVP